MSALPVWISKHPVAEIMTDVSLLTGRDLSNSQNYWEAKSQEV